jgi:hypothetical protein
MTTFTNEELGWLHTLLEGHAEVAADNGDQIEAARLSAMVNDAPVISSADAEWMVEDLQDYDDEPDAISLRAKLAALIAAYRDTFNANLTTENTKVIRIWDTIYGFWIEIDLVNAIEVARAAFVRKKLGAEK